MKTIGTDMSGISHWKTLSDLIAGRPVGATPGAGCFAIARFHRTAPPPANPLAGTHCVTMPTADQPPLFDVYADNPAAIGRWHDLQTDTAVYVWGHAAHSDVADDALLPWMADQVRAGRTCRLRDMVGTNDVPWPHSSRSKCWRSELVAVIGT